MKITKSIDVSVTVRAVFRDGNVKVHCSLGVPYGPAGKQRVSHYSEDLTAGPEVDAIAKALTALADREAVKLLPKAEILAQQALTAAANLKEI